MCELSVLLWSAAFRDTLEVFCLLATKKLLDSGEYKALSLFVAV